MKEKLEMVRHVILWQLKEGYTNSEIAVIKADIKSGLEGLLGVVPGLIKISVIFCVFYNCPFFCF